jgi:hypothetical protein
VRRHTCGAADFLRFPTHGTATIRESSRRQRADQHGLETLDDIGVCWTILDAPYLQTPGWSWTPSKFLLVQLRSALSVREALLRQM